MIITLNMLQNKRACADQVETFEGEFGDSVVVTLELCLIYASIFDFCWAAHNLLSSEKYESYALERKEARKVFNRAENHAWMAYRNGYVDANNQRLKEGDFRRAIDVQWKIFLRAKATAFAREALK